MSPQRPFGVTLLLWLVLILSAWGAVRFFAALRFWDVLNEFDARLSPLYLSATGAGWGAVGGVLFWGVMSRRAWMPSVVMIAAFVWQIQYWVERIFFQSPRANLPFALIASLFLLIITTAITLYPSTKQFFKRSEAHERKTDHSTTA